MIQKDNLSPTSTSSPKGPKERSNKFGRGAKFGLGLTSLGCICGSIFGAAWLSQEFSPINGFNRDLEYTVQQLVNKVLALDGMVEKPQEEANTARETDDSESKATGEEQPTPTSSAQGGGEEAGAKTVSYGGGGSIWSYFERTYSWYPNLIKP